MRRSAIRACPSCRAISVDRLVPLGGLALIPKLSVYPSEALAVGYGNAPTVPNLNLIENNMLLFQFPGSAILGRQLLTLDGRGVVSRSRFVNQFVIEGRARPSLRRVSSFESAGGMGLTPSAAVGPENRKSPRDRYTMPVPGGIETIRS